MTKIVLVDDHAVFRESFRLAIAGDERFQIVGETGDSRHASDLIERLAPDVAVLDVLISPLDGISVVRELKRRKTATRAMILTMRDSELTLREALEAGALGYVLKEQPLTQVMQAMESVGRGERYVAPRLAEFLDGAINPRLFGLKGLSAREREVFHCILRGLTNLEIARALFISIKTVQTHRVHINRKLGTHSTADLIRLAATHGLLPAEGVTGDSANAALATPE